MAVLVWFSTLFSLPGLLGLSDAVFLEAQVPLKVVSILPERDSSDPNPRALVSGRNAITVVFSRPIIALGSDFSESIPDGELPFCLYDSAGNMLSLPGKLRYATTFIARLDLDIDWPTDLDFSVQINPSLKAFDGALLTGSLMFRDYRTDDLQGYIADVSSPYASNITAGGWNAFTTPASSAKPEVPPDGVMRVSFTAPIDLNSVQSALSLSSSSSAGVGSATVVGENCIDQNNDTHCLWLKPRKLAVNTAYTITIPAGTKYHPLSGPLRKSIVFTLTGLLPFAFPFYADSCPTCTTSYRRFNLWLRHGLADVSWSATALNSAFRLTSTTPAETLALTVTKISPSMIQIAGNVRPKTKYTLNMLAGSLVDGYGLSLLADSTQFTTGSVSNYLTQPPGFTVLESSQTGPGFTWPVLLQRGDTANGNSDRTISVGPVTPDNFLQVLSGTLFSNMMSGTTSTAISQGADGAFRIAQLPLPGNGRFFWRQESQTWGAGSAALTIIADLGVYAIVEPGEVVIWVTDYAAGGPVQGANVTLFQGDWNTASLRGYAITDANGLAIFPISGSTNLRYAAYVTTSNSKQGFLNWFYPAPSTLQSEKASLFTDRGLYKPGDVVYVKSYYRVLQGGSWVVCPKPESMQVYVLWNDQGSNTTVNMSFANSFGSTSATFVVPADAEYGTKTLYLRDLEMDTLTSTTFVISDPRVPTATLEIAVNEPTYVPNVGVHLNAKVMTGTGLPITNAQVQITWTLTAAPPPRSGYMYNDFYGGGGEGRGVSTTTPPAALATGTVTLSTDADGQASGSILSSLAALGQKLNIQAIYIGPTGELLQDSASVPVATSSWSLSIQVPSWVTQSGIPGYDFGVIPEITDLDGNEVTVPVTVNLNLLLDGTSVSSCTAHTNCSSSAPQCTFNFPNLGDYEIHATAVDPHGVTLSAVLEVGKSVAEWNANPPTSFAPYEFYLDKDEYAEGDVATLSFRTPFSGGWALLRWGNNNSKQLQQVNTTPGLNTVAFVIGSECDGGCTLAVALASPRQDNSAALLPAGLVPSKLLDVHAPSSAFQSLALTITPKQAKIIVDISLPTHQYQPGDNVALTVQLLDENSLLPLTGEVSVVVVDSAFLQLQDHPLEPLDEDFEVNLAQPFSGYSADTSLACVAGLTATTSIATRRNGLDPWVTPSWQTNGNNIYGAAAEVDQSDSDYFAKSTYGLTQNGWIYTPYYYYPSGPIAMERGVVGDALAPPVAGGAVPADAEITQPGGSPSSSTSPSPSPSPSTALVVIPARSNFETVPYFAGSITVSTQPTPVTFKLPDNVGSFTIRVYGASASSSFAATEEKINVLKPLSLIPSLPLTSRVGDYFEAGVTVGASDPSFNGNVTVSAAVGSVQNGMVSTTVHVVGTTPVKATFNIELQAQGVAMLNFQAVANSNSAMTDALLTNLTVEPVQSAVLVATSMGLTAAPEATEWDEQIAFPAAVPGTGTLSVLAGVGRKSVIEKWGEALDDVTWITGSVIIGQAGIIGAEARYDVPPQDKIDAVFRNLRLYSDASLGLKWYPDAWQINVEMNAFAVDVANRASDAGLNFPSDIVDWWTQAIDTGLCQAAANARRSNYIYSDWETLARVFLAMGPHWQPANCDPILQLDLSLSRLESNIQSVSLSGQVALALSLAIQSGNNAPDLVSAVADRVFSALRVQGRTAYVGATMGFAFDMECQALSLHLLIISPSYSSSLLVEKLANYVAQGNANAAGALFMYSPRSVGLSALALARYDSGRNNVNADLTLIVASGTQQVMDASFQGAGSPLQSTTKLWTDLTKSATPPPPLPTVEISKDLEVPAPLGSLADLQKLSPSGLTFLAKGVGEASVAVGISFVPAFLSPNPIYRGIYVTKSIQLVDLATNEITGTNLQVVQSGVIVEVTIQITTPDDLTEVVIEDLVPGGLEPIDPSLSSTGNLGDTSSSSQASSSWMYWWRWWNPFSHTEVRSDKVIWTGSWISAGTYTVSYRALSNTPGVWQLPPARAYVSAQPELMGLSGGSVFLVSAQYIPADQVKSYITSRGVIPAATFASAPIECTDACNQATACNLNTGKCECVSNANCDTTPLDCDANVDPNCGLQPLHWAPKKSKAWIAGVVVGVLAFLACIGGGVAYCLKRKRNGPVHVEMRQMDEAA